MNGHIGRAIALDHGLPQRHARQRLTGHRAAHLQGFGQGDHRLQLLLQSPGLQAPHHIRSQLYTRADFAELLRAFKQPHIAARSCGPNTRGQSTDSAAGNQHLLFHGSIVPAFRGPLKSSAYGLFSKPLQSDSYPRSVASRQRDSSYGICNVFSNASAMNHYGALRVQEYRTESRRKLAQ